MKYQSRNQPGGPEHKIAPALLERPPTQSVEQIDASLPCATCAGRATNVCGVLEGQRLSNLFHAGSRRRWSEREFLFRADGELGPIFKVRSGMVAISRSLESGQRQIVRFALPGDICGYLAANGRYSFDGEAITEVVVCSFPRQRFDALVQHDTDVAEATRRELSTVTTETGLHMASLGQLATRARVAKFLCDMTVAFEARHMPFLPGALPMRRADVADYLGMRIETVSRALTGFEQQKIIAIEKNGGVAILDHAALAGISGSAKRPSATRSAADS
ncbi:MAG: Crp/Fnr family transcriptional regulator [Proteobacteria bacterium]|nr:Crp/Fnr family transcriptional regulator [Pseudomonadota bacterium]